MQEHYDVCSIKTNETVGKPAHHECRLDKLTFELRAASGWSDRLRSDASMTAFLILKHFCSPVCTDSNWKTFGVRASDGCKVKVQHASTALRKNNNRGVVRCEAHLLISTCTTQINLFNVMSGLRMHDLKAILLFREVHMPPDAYAWVKWNVCIWYMVRKCYDLSGCETLRHLVDAGTICTNRTSHITSKSNKNAHQSRSYR